MFVLIKAKIKSRRNHLNLERTISQMKTFFFLKSDPVMFRKKFAVVYVVCLLFGLLPCQSQDSKPIFFNLINLHALFD